MICPRCANKNAAGRTHCFHCGTPLPVPEAAPQSTPPPQAAGVVRLRVVLPCAVIAIILLVLGYAQWRAGHPREAQAQPDAEAAAAQEQQRTNDALARVPLVNARANDLLRAGNISRALKLVDEILEIVDA